MESSLGISIAIYLRDGYDQSTTSGVDKVYKYSELDKARLDEHEFIFRLRYSTRRVFSIVQTDNLSYNTEPDPEYPNYYNISYFYISDLTKNSSLRFIHKSS